MWLAAWWSATPPNSSIRSSADCKSIWSAESKRLGRFDCLKRRSNGIVSVPRFRSGRRVSERRCPSIRREFSTRAAECGAKSRG